MQMTKGEICGSYRDAKKKREQIKILAELNGCDTKTIRHILIEGGYELGGKPPKLVNVESTAFDLNGLVELRREVEKDLKNVPTNYALDIIFWRLAVLMGRK